MTDTDDAEQKRLIAVHNERLKLAATYINGLAIALFAVGSFGPTVAVIMSSGTPIAGIAAVVATVCASASVALHYVASRILKGLRV